MSDTRCQMLAEVPVQLLVSRHLPSAIFHLPSPSAICHLPSDSCSQRPMPRPLFHLCKGVEVLYNSTSHESGNFSPSRRELV